MFECVSGLHKGTDIFGCILADDMGLVFLSDKHLNDQITNSQALYLSALFSLISLKVYR